MYLLFYAGCIDIMPGTERGTEFSIPSSHDQWLLFPAHHLMLHLYIHKKFPEGTEYAVMRHNMMTSLK